MEQGKRGPGRPKKAEVEEKLIEAYASVKRREMPYESTVAINEDEGPVVVRLNLPPELYAKYAELAEKQGLTPAELLQNRLERCVEHSSLRPLYFSDSQRAQLENLIQKRPLETAEQVLPLLSSLLTFKVGEFEVPITNAQARRLQLSAYANMTVEDRLVQIVQGALSKSLGV